MPSWKAVFADLWVDAETFEEAQAKVLKKIEEEGCPLMTLEQEPRPSEVKGLRKQFLKTQR